MPKLLKVITLVIVVVGLWTIHHRSRKEGRSRPTSDVASISEAMRQDKWHLAPMKDLSIRTFAQGMWHQWMQCAGLPTRTSASQTNHSLLPVTLAVLDVGLSRTLHQSVDKWKAQGVWDFMAQWVVFVQQIRPEHCAYAAQEGFELVGNTGNVGIAAALEVLITTARHAHIVFLEKDWQPVISYTPPLVRQYLRMGQRLLMEQPNISVVYFRHKHATSKKCVLPDMRRIFNPNRDPCAVKKQAWTGTSAFVGLWGCPRQALALGDYFTPCAADSRVGDATFYCFGARFSHWSNTPSLFRRAWALQHFVPNLPLCNPLDPLCLYAGVEFDNRLQCAVRRTGTLFASPYPGLFRHMDRSTEEECRFPPLRNPCPAGCRPAGSRCRGNFVAAAAGCCCFRSHEPAPPAAFALLANRTFVAWSVPGWNAVSAGRWPAVPAPAPPALLDLGYKPRGAAFIVTAADMQRLQRFLDRVNDRVPYAHRLLLTAYVHTSGPSVAAMRALGCPAGPACAYRRWWLHNGTDADGLGAAPYKEPGLRAAYARAFRAGHWHPEYGGGGAVDPATWLKALERDRVAQGCFALGLVCGRYNVPEYAHLSGPALRAHIASGVRAFAAFFGFSPSVTVPVDGVGPCELGEALRDAAFVGADAPHVRAWTYRPVSRKVSPPFAERGLGAAAPVGWDPRLSAAEVKARVRQRGTPFVVFRLPATFFAAGDDAEGLEGRERRLRALVDELRADGASRTVFVTSGELHQVALRGWSVEVWHDCAVVRNYRDGAVTFAVPKTFGVAGTGRVSVECLTCEGARTAAAECRPGPFLEVQPGQVLRLRDCGG